jgi:acyl transferase domain-containing protein
VTGVSSFGLSGTNVHVILRNDRTQRNDNEINSENSPGHKILLLSAKSLPNLVQVCAKYAALLEEENSKGDFLSRVCAGTARFRNHGFQHRVSFVADSCGSMAAQLRKFVETEGKSTDRQKITRVAFQFSGQGGTVVGMAKEIYATCPKFRQTLEFVDSMAKKYTSRSLVECLYPSEKSEFIIPELTPMMSQMALFAVQYSIAQLWKFWGINPEYVFIENIF